jgi:hypothetical protein
VEDPNDWSADADTETVRLGERQDGIAFRTNVKSAGLFSGVPGGTLERENFIE